MPGVDVIGVFLRSHVDLLRAAPDTHVGMVRIARYPGGYHLLAPLPVRVKPVSVMDGDSGRSEAMGRETMENLLPMVHRYPQGYMMYSTN
jgi:hypothetical protein